MSVFLTKDPETFAALFREFRFRANIRSLRILCGLLADLGFVVEESTLSRWQNGTRTPRDRKLVLALIIIFAIRDALTNTEEANQLLRLAKLVPLTSLEEQQLSLKGKKQASVSLPPKPDIVGAHDLVESIRNLLYSSDGHLKAVMYGLPGTGKSSAAIFIAHEFQSFFDKGIIWLRASSYSIAAIKESIRETLLSTAEHSDGIELSDILNSKNFLIVFDDVDDEQSLNEIIKHFSNCSFIISTNIYPGKLQGASLLEIKPLQLIDVYEIFSRAANRSTNDKEKVLIGKIARRLGNLTYPISIIANTLKNDLSEQSLRHTLLLLESEDANSEFLQENFSPIITAFGALFDQLDTKEQAVLEAIAAKERPRFLAESIEIDHTGPAAIQWILFTLSSKSLITKINDNTYQINPLLHHFLRTRGKELRLTGKWHCKYYYSSNSSPGRFVGEYDLDAHRADEQLIMQSSPNDFGNHLLIRLMQDGRVVTGTWHESTSPQGRYKESIYHGALQLVVSENGQSMKGKWVGFNRQMSVQSGSWEIVRIDENKGSG